MTHDIARAASTRPADTQKPTRNQLFAGLALLASLNAFAGNVAASVAELGLLNSAFALFGVSAILWVALAAALALLLGEAADSPPTGLDWGAGVVVFGAALLPTATASGVALTGLALWAIVSGASRPRLRRAGLILLAMTGALVWGKLILAVFANPFLDMDVLFVSGLLGAEHDGNVIWREGGPMSLVVSTGCSSMNGVSIAIVFWATVNQYFGVPFGWRAAISGAAAIGATVLINVLRIGAMLTWPAHFHAIHEGVGSIVYMWVTLLAVVAICVWGGRREIFARV